MYLVFRSVELGLSNYPAGAIKVALNKRFQYGEDMITSGKWGRDVTNLFGQLTKIPGTRGHDYWYISQTSEFIKHLDALHTGDIIFCNCCVTFLV